MGDVTLSSFLGMTPQTVLDKVKQVDGPDSGLDSDTIDGKHASDFAAATAGASVATGYWKSNAAQYGVNAATVTGSLVIKTSIPSGSSNMVRVVVRGYDYSANGTWVVECGGYFYSTGPTLINHSVQIYGAPPSSEVRHAISPDGFKCIIIGVDTTVWKYPRFNVDAMVGYSGSAALADGWTASIESNTTTYTQKVLFAANQPIANITGLQTALDDKFSKSTANTITQSTVIASELKIDSGGYVWFTGTSYLDMNNKNIVGVNRLMFADPGDDEGIGWAGGNGWRIWEGPNTLGNGSGNLQIVTNYDVTPTRHSTFLTDGSFEVTTGPIRVGSSVVWHAGNFTPTLSGLTNVNITSPVDGHVLTYDSASSKWVNRVPPAGGGGGSGTVTSVGLSLPNIFSVTGSPVTSSGTLTGSLVSQTAKTFFAAPNGAAGTPSFRAIVASDIPTLNQNTTGSSGSCSGNAATATTLQTARTINGTSFNGSAAITTASWGTTRTLTIGSTGKSVDGSGNVSWSLAEIGAAPTSNASFSGLTTIAGQLQSSGTDMLLGANGGWIYFRPNGYASSTGQGFINASGVFVGTDFSLSSDIRLKKDIRPLSVQGRLAPVIYTRVSTGEEELGFIAQYVERIYPQVVFTGPDGYKSISYSKLTAVLAAHVNALEDENLRLRESIEELQTSVSELKHLIAQVITAK